MRIQTSLGAMLLLSLVAYAEEQPATQPAGAIAVTDKAALELAKGASVTVEGRVVLAEWSRSGKVLNIDFDGAPHFMAAAFEKSRAKLDESFNGDIAASLSGAVIKITGKISDYGGKAGKYEGAMQIVLRDASQLTIVLPAPATQPAESSTP